MQKYKKPLITDGDLNQRLAADMEGIEWNLYMFHIC